MFKFQDDELCIAIITYNRPTFIAEWLKCCYKDACDRNISISIFDSSSNTETQTVIENFKQEENYKIEYYRLDSETILGYKPMIPLLSLNKKFVWICGDSRRHNFAELDENVFPYINDEFEYILFLADNRQKPQIYSYADLNKFIKDCFISSTCIGFSVYKLSIFDYIKNDCSIEKKYDTLFKNNYGFGWLGYFYNAFSKGKYKAITCRVKTLNIFPKKKKQVWAKRFYECWIDNLCQVIDNIPDIYSEKNSVPKIVWDGLKLYSDQYCYLARKNGDLNTTTFARYEKEGFLDRVTTHKTNIKFYANAPLVFVEIKYTCSKIAKFAKRAVSKLIRMVKGEDGL